MQTEIYFEYVNILYFQVWLLCVHEYRPFVQCGDVTAHFVHAHCCLVFNMVYEVSHQLNLVFCPHFRKQAKEPAHKKWLQNFNFLFKSCKRKAVLQRKLRMSSYEIACKVYRHRVDWSTCLSFWSRVVQLDTVCVNRISWEGNYLYGKIFVSMYVDTVL